MVAFPVMFVFHTPNITVERYHILYFVLQGVQTQSPEIRISLGGSALFANLRTMPVELKANKMVYSMRKNTRAKLKRKDRWLLLALLLMLLLPLNMAAQQDGSHGLFGRGGNRDGIGDSGSVMNQGFGTTQGGLMNQGFGATDGNVTNQGFGGTNGGITNQTFGAPLGSGLFILLATGAGYALLKTKKRKSNR